MASDPSSQGAAAKNAAKAQEAPEDPRFRVMRKLVNILLVVMIAGTLSISIALMIKLKDLRTPIHALAEGETIISATATEDRITLVLSGADGAQRVVILDAANFQPVREILTPKPE